MEDDRDPVAAYRSAALRYVAVIDAAEGRPVYELLEDLLPALAALYEAGLRLPDVEPDTTDAPDWGMTDEGWWKLFTQLGETLGTHDTYWSVEEPFGEEEPELFTRSLADDLADVYRCAKNGLDGEAAGAPENDVLWLWRFDFQTEAGRDALDAMRIIRMHLYET